MQFPAATSVRHAIAQSSSVLLWILVAGLFAQNVLLLRQNRQLKSVPAAPPVVPINDAVPAGRILRDLSGVGLDGRYREIALPSAAGHHLLILTFSSGCDACDMNQAQSIVAAAVARRAGWSVAWISRDPVPKAAAWSKAVAIESDDVFTEVPNPTYRELGVSTVPKIIAVGPGGVVERVWPGQLDARDFADMKGFFTAPLSTAAAR